jgi:hypothetical protein
MMSATYSESRPSPDDYAVSASQSLWPAVSPLVPSGMWLEFRAVQSPGN